MRFYGIEKIKYLVILPLTFSKISKECFEEELEVFKIIAENFIDLPITFYIKPKPLSNFITINDFPKNCILGYDDGDSNVNKKLLIDHDYSNYRAFIIKKAKLILNIGTTFVLDASFAKTNILQLKISNKKNWHNLTESCKNYHQEQYLYTKDNFFDIRSKDDLKKINIEKYIYNKNKLNPATEKLNQWLTEPLKDRVKISQVITENLNINK